MLNPRIAIIVAAIFIATSAAAQEPKELRDARRQFEDELKDYDTSNGTIRFPANRPLPPALVRKLVKRRIAKKGS